MAQLLELLATELERPRQVTEQVVRHITETHNVDREQVGEFLVNVLPNLEEFEVDLVLSPLFTPGLNDQAAVASFLGGASVPASEWPALVSGLVARPTRARLITDDGHEHTIELPEVMIERFVHRLRLEGGIPESLLAWLRAQVPAAAQPRLLAVARRAIWETPGRLRLLEQFLEAALGESADLPEDAAALLRLGETYQPADVAELRALIPHWLDVLRADINAGATPKPFFNERVEELHGGGRDQRRPVNSQLAGKRAEAEYLQRLQRWLAAP